MSDIKWNIGEAPIHSIIVQKPKWRMDMFGDNNLVFMFNAHKSWWARMWCTIIFGAKWRRL